MVLLLFLKCWEAGEIYLTFFNTCTLYVQRAKYENRVANPSLESRHHPARRKGGGRYRRQKIYKVSRFKGNIASDPRGQKERRERRKESLVHVPERNVSSCRLDGGQEFVCLAPSERRGQLYLGPGWLSILGLKKG